MSHPSDGTEDRSSLIARLVHDLENDLEAMRIRLRLALDDAGGPAEHLASAMGIAGDARERLAALKELVVNGSSDGASLAVSDGESRGG